MKGERGRKAGVDKEAGPRQQLVVLRQTAERGSTAGQQQRTWRSKTITEQSTPTTSTTGVSSGSVLWHNTVI
ncbi:hypothetical protein E2C01_041715 [Portunus trituberculatus]|uniref:Uncharacterized protein n=1 Tax=Portunus trituberculatus TaxID=210409 RepID=A0A5B7FUG6_PORTR|nr:hypothetical protein [Portunus trituberculatus]